MDKRLDQMDWALVQCFLAVAEAGSLSEAARRTGVSQPTLGRRMRDLEARLGLPLFARHAKGFELTDQARELLPQAQAAAEALSRFALTAAGHDGRLSGTVRVTASHVVATHLLPPVLARLRAEEPALTIELVASDEADNLLFREADIAIRMFRPTQLDLITKHLGGLPLAAFAAKSYLDRRGRPETLADLRHHDIVGYDQSPLMIEGMRRHGIAAEKSWFTTRCDDQVAYMELVRAGCGIGIGQARILRDDPEVEHLDLIPAIEPLPVWITATEALYRAPRIRRVWEALETGLAPFVS